jgi:Kef-type K+ transport system membrane component KefB
MVSKNASVRMPELTRLVGAAFSTALARFAFGMVLIFGIPPLARRIRLPVAVGLLLSGVVIGPYVLGVFGEKRPIADFMAELGVLLLMFVSGLEIDVNQFRQARTRSMLFGVLTTGFPLLLGTAVGLIFGYKLIPAVVIGSLLASHTLLGGPIVVELGVNQLEPIVITIGATVLSDTLSLVVFAICVSTYTTGFSTSAFVLQIVEIAVFVPFVLLGISRLGAYLLKTVEAEENAYFVLMFGIMATAGVLAGLVNLPGIVGAFLAGLAVNESVHDKPAKEKLKFFGDSFFIPIFFAVTGFLINPIVFVRSIFDSFGLVVAIVLALVVGKFIAARTAGRRFKYTSAARMTMWSLTLPQVAATLAAALVAFRTYDPLHQRLLDERMLNVILVLMLSTAILGPLLTQHFGLLLSKEVDGQKDALKPTDSDKPKRLIAPGVPFGPTSS